MKYIFKGQHSGIFYGELADQVQDKTIINNVRQIWSYRDSGGLFQLSQEGPTNTSSMQLTMAIPTITIMDCVIIIPCSKIAEIKFDSIPEWKL